MILCKICGQSAERYPSLKLCKKCYQNDYNKKYYQKNKDKIKERTSKYYIDNIEKERIKRKINREKMHFDSKRKQVLRRDDYTCIRCNSRKEGNDTKNLIVHHKDRLGRGSEVKNNDLQNLITLCRSCHAKEHSKDLKLALKEKYKNKWAMKYDCCIECGTTERKHHGKGLCVNCHARYLKRKRMKI